MLRMLDATSLRWYAPWTKVFSAGHILGVILSHASNSLVRKIPDWRKRCIVLFTICGTVYGVAPRIAISWHSSILWKSDSGVSTGLKGDVNVTLLFQIMFAVGLPNVVSNWDRMAWLTSWNSTP